MALHSPELPEQSLKIRCFSIMPTLCVCGGSYPFTEMQSANSLAPVEWAMEVTRLVDLNGMSTRLGLIYV